MCGNLYIQMWDGLFPSILSPGYMIYPYLHLSGFMFRGRWVPRKAKHLNLIFKQLCVAILKLVLTMVFKVKCVVREES